MAGHSFGRSGFENEIQNLKFTLEMIKSKECWSDYNYYPFATNCMPTYSATFSEVKIVIENFNDQFERKPGITPTYPYIQVSGLMEKRVNSLQNFLEHGETITPELECLLSFLREKEQHSAVLAKYREKKNEVAAESTLVLAVHLLSKLFPKSPKQISFAVDNCMFQKGLDKKCPCGCTKLEENASPTDIGKAEVWHGRTDILLLSQFYIPVTVAAVEEEACTSLGQLAVSDDDTSSSDDGYDVLNDLDVTAQVVSQTIVGSFANASVCSHIASSDRSKLYPGLCCTLDQIGVYYYDCEVDVLIARGAHIELWDNRGDRPVISDAAILELWLILNFQPELTEKALEMFPKSGFYRSLTPKALACYRASTIGKLISAKEKKKVLEEYKRRRKQFNMPTRNFRWCKFEDCNN